MDVHAALEELTELSAQVEAAVVLGPDDAVEGATPDDRELAEALARSGRELLAAAAESHPGHGLPTRVEVALPGRSVFAVREAGRTIVATTVAEPVAGLVLYDLRTCLTRCAEPEPGA